MAWWREAKYGMFIHWGIYSIPADGEWHMRNRQKSFAEYSQYAGKFNPIKFDPDVWMTLAHDAGMKYVVITTKHHDGFAMFKSKASSYNVVDATPFKRDVVKELAEACPRHGIRFGTYYSFLADWGHKGGQAGCPHWDPAFQDGDLHEYIRTVALPQLKEILSNYGPISELWFDTDGAKGITPQESAQVVEIIKTTQPKVLVDQRLPGVKGDFITPEQTLPSFAPQGDAELCATVNGAWGYRPSAAKPLNQLLPYMITAWGMGCNILMNVGPTPEGIIPEDSARRLLEVGAWLKTYGESIYGSTAGPFSFVPWGTATRKGDTVYLQIFKWPADGKLRVPLTNEAKSATLLGTEKKEDLKFSRENGRLVIQLPDKGPDAVANVVALKVEGEPKSDYRSLVLNKPVKASSGQATAAKAVDERETSWDCEQPTGWLEIDAGTPVTVGTLRLQGNNMKKCSLEYKSGNEWKPIFQGEKFGGGRMVQLREFSPVTARYFRFTISESEKNPQIRDLELYPPL